LAQTLTIGINAIGLKVGTYHGTITVSDPDAENSPRTIDVAVFVRARVPPAISNLDVNLTRLNDPTCANPQGPGSRFRATFDYEDTNGDVPIAGGSFEGKPVEVTAGFPDFSPTTTMATAEVEGDGFSGQAGFDLCIYFWEWGGANLWVRLEDEWNLFSNQLFKFIDRPEGANSPAQGSVAQGSGGRPGEGSVVIQSGSGG
jgi:hypothetical protein